MWKIAYNLLTFAAFPLFALYSLSQAKIRRNFRDRLFGRPKAGDLDGALWIHAASIGEAVIAQNLLSYLRASSPLRKYIVTTNTDYARDLAESRIHGVPAYALPFDFALSMRRFLSRSRPLALVIVETEIWPNLIWQAKKRGIPVFIVNGRISDSTFKTYRFFSFFFKAVLSGVDLVLAQSEEHARRFTAMSLDPAKVLVTGNIKFFRDVEAPGEPVGQRKAVTFGSIREKEFDSVRTTLGRLLRAYPDYTFYIAPRELHLAAPLLDQLSREFSVTTFSLLKSGTGKPAPVVIVDTVGDLMEIYGRSTLAFVGGSLAPYGGQNILEPLFFGTPVLFGPHVENFQEIAADILREGAGVQVKDGAELANTIEELLSDAAKREAIGAAGMRLVGKQKEAMTLTARIILEALPARCSSQGQSRRK
jgi:3-deoxy-D-manno-octulosonic-acid transferase